MLTTAVGRNRSRGNPGSMLVLLLPPVLVRLEIHGRQDIRHLHHILWPADHDSCACCERWRVRSLDAG